MIDFPLRQLVVLAMFATSLTLCPTTRAAPAIETIAPRIQAVTIQSTVLNTAKTYCAVLPDGYEKTNNSWPVLFLFHGRGRHERSLIDDASTRAALLKAPFVTILPDGDDGWYINSPVRQADRYQDYMEEVVAHATGQFNLSTRPEQRGLSGWSMGGFGCTRYAIDHAGKFTALAPIIGLLDFPRAGLPEGQSYDVPEDRFGTDGATWKALNPLNQADALRDMQLCLITGATAFDRTMNMNFSRRLADLHIPHTLHVLDGGHTFDVVRASVPIVVDFMADALARNDTPTE